MNEDVGSPHQRLREHLDEQLDKTLRPLTSVRDLGKIRERELLDLGVYLLEMGLAVLSEVDLYRPDLEAAVATAAIAAKGRTDQPLLPRVSELISTQTDQLTATRAALDEATPALQQEDRQYLAVVAALDTTLSAFANLTALFNIVPSTYV
ncbi:MULTISPECIES: hypothetical protein [Amycolatopsis]|uniref:Uncharacterized protein n=2 Tax=Amycolatopsis TaxID=1813 RepID=A0A1I4AAX3_9PSEU|nr:hypothetical protein [Amycolatopsis sacchari]SFK53101.1 hypothetical protein SAMN05421835_12386 [Amycolatopsis sacchari]